MLFFFQAEDGIRYLVRSRGLGDVYKRQVMGILRMFFHDGPFFFCQLVGFEQNGIRHAEFSDCLLYTSDAADERSSVDLGGRRIIKKKNKVQSQCAKSITTKHT